MTMTRPRGHLIVVGGHSRHVGKTTLITQLIPHLKPANWLAVKISSHRHGASGEGFSVAEEHDPSTSRYLAAGAQRAFLLRAADKTVAEAAAWIEFQLATGHSVIAESNRLVRFIRPDLVLFVVEPRIRDWKASSGECLRQADAVVWAEQDSLQCSCDFGGIRIIPMRNGPFFSPFSGLGRAQKPRDYGANDPLAGQRRRGALFPDSRILRAAG